MNKDVSRYRDEGETIYGQMQEILVACPRCHACSRITLYPAVEPHPVVTFTPRRLVCASCGLVREWKGNSLGFEWNGDPMRDSYFGLPLWLQTPCCGHILWAYNLHHLELIEKYVQAQLREHRRDLKVGWHSHSLVQQLPQWMIIARHRQAVLDAIAKLKAAQ